jgi:hypothetical protein
MTDPVKPTATPEEIEEKAKKEKEEKRTKERDTVRKTVEDAAKAHDELGKKFLKEDAEEAEKKLKEVEKKK